MIGVGKYQLIAPSPSDRRAYHLLWALLPSKYLVSQVWKYSWLILTDKSVRISMLTFRIPREATKAEPRPHLWHGKIVHKDRHLLASRRAEVLTPTLVQLHLNGILTHEWRCRAREVDPTIHHNIWGRLD